jgi:hypothetical protein
VFNGHKGVAVKHLFRSTLVGLVLLSLMVTGPAAAAQPQPPGDGVTTQPLVTLLNPDGTLNLTTGFSGSLDPAGWQLTAGPGGEPLFAPAIASLDEGASAGALGDEA